jgi:hypothetical protein
VKDGLRGDSRSKSPEHRAANERFSRSPAVRTALVLSALGALYATLVVNYRPFDSMMNQQLMGHPFVDIMALLFNLGAINLLLFGIIVFVVFPVAALVILGFFHSIEWGFDRLAQVLIALLARRSLVQLSLVLSALVLALGFVLELLVS